MSSAPIPAPTWTERELEAEHRYLYQERLAILGCDGEPTPEQHDMAKREADSAISKLRGTLSQSVLSV